MMNVLITGINGFAGSFLAEKLLEAGEQVCGIYQKGTSKENIDDILDKIKLYEADILDGTALSKAVQDIKPHAIFHLAGYSSAKGSFNEPKQCIEINVSGTVNLLEAARKFDKDIAVIAVSSGEVYGKNEAGQKPVNEKTPHNPLNPYAASKSSADLLSRAYARAFDMKVVVARPLNHIGPRQSSSFFIPTLAKQIAVIEKGRVPPVLKLGNLNVKKDFTDVRDIAEAYVRLAKKGGAGEAYNICSGRKYPLSDVVELMISMAKMKISVEMNKDQLRKNDEDSVDMDTNKIRQLTGWAPEYAIEQTLRDVLEYWRLRV